MSPGSTIPDSEPRCGSSTRSGMCSSDVSRDPSKSPYSDAGLLEEEEEEEAAGSAVVVSAPASVDGRDGAASAAEEEEKAEPWGQEEEEEEVEDAPTADLVAEAADELAAAFLEAAPAETVTLPAGVDDASTRPNSFVEFPLAGLAGDLEPLPADLALPEASLPPPPSPAPCDAPTQPASFSDEEAFLAAYAAITGTVSLAATPAESPAASPGASPEGRTSDDAHPAFHLQDRPETGTRLPEHRWPELPLPKDPQAEPSQLEPRCPQDEALVGAGVRPGAALKALVGTWNIVMSEEQLVCRVREDGSVLYNGKHLGDRFDLVEDTEDFGVVRVRRGDGWVLDVKSSKVGLLVWTKPGLSDVAWHRVARVPGSARGAGRASAEEGTCCPERGNVIRGSSIDLQGTTQVSPAGMFSCAACAVRSA